MSRNLSICKYLGRNDLKTNLLTICWKGKQSLQVCNTRREETKTGTMRMTALVKGSVTRGHAPPSPEAHVIEYARGSAIELYGRNFTRYFSKLGSIKKSAYFKTCKQSPAFDARLER